MSAVTPIRPITPAARRHVPVQQAPDRTGPTGRPLRAVDESTEVRTIVRSTVQAAMEVLAGIRPVQQLARRLEPGCLATLQHRALLIRRELSRSPSPSLARLHKNSVVRSVHLCEVRPGVYEASAVVVDDVRARAVAIRLERSKEVWLVTEFLVG